jgi:putative ATP-dependent endonuclease of OLD family
MRLTHVLIESFRGIGRLELALDRLTVVIGENNHGKSSLVDVLECCLGRPGAPAPTHFAPTDFRHTARPRVDPIRVVLTFEHDDDAMRDGRTHSLFDVAMTSDPDGTPRLRVEFTGHPGTGTMEARFIDGEGHRVEPPPHAIVLAKLRQLHPVLVVRLAQPHVHDGLEWERAEARDQEGPQGDPDALDEEDIARVYRRLAEARGPVPTEEVRRALQAIRRTRDTIADRYVEDEGPLRGLLEPLVGGERTEGDGADGASSERGGDDAPPRRHGMHRAPTPGGGSHALGLLIVLGSLIDVRGDTALPRDAHPIVAIEEPETHLHPMMVASTWDVIEHLRSQALVITNSGEFLAEVPLRFVRRLVRRDGRIDAYHLRDKTLSADGLRRVGYHIRAKRGSVLFARCWLLVEGETEFWLMRQLALVLGYDLEAEGVRCVEFAQCGVEPLVRLANDLRIEWHLLADGDEAGASYTQEARQHLPSGSPKRHITRLHKRTIEMELWSHGYDGLYREAAGVPEESEGDGPEHRRPRLRGYHIVNRAIRRHSKPFLALTVAEEAARRGPDGVPPSLRRVIEESVSLARSAVHDG